MTTERKFEVRFQHGVFERWLEHPSTDGSRGAVRDWIAGFVDGPPLGSVVVFDEDRITEYDPTYLSVRRAMADDVVEIRFFVVADERELLILITYLGPVIMSQ